MSSRTQIIATIGPSSGEPATIARMIKAGMDVARINFSHGTHESNGAYIMRVREAAKQAGKKIPIIQDLAGPRMETSDGHTFDTGALCITPKDLEDLEFGIAQHVEYVAQSFVGTAADITCMRDEMQKRKATIPIIAKIERKEAVENFDSILFAADAIMIARGDLGDAVPMEDIPFLERMMAKRAREAGKPVIVATQMLYSMSEHRTPTRAEVTDVAFAIIVGADLVMLSDETALGAYPAETVAVMERIVSRAEAIEGTKRVDTL